MLAAEESARIKFTLGFSVNGIPLKNKIKNLNAENTVNTPLQFLGGCSKTVSCLIYSDKHLAMVLYIIPKSFFFLYGIVF